jgi:glycerol uptake facilitator-like aquaporin
MPRQVAELEMPGRPQRLAAEFAGTALLVAGVVGSGIMGERLSDGNDAVALLGNTLATGALLAVLILIFGPVSGAQFNPAVSFALALRGEMSWRDVAYYLPAQIGGALCGTLLAHLMFDMPLVTASQHVRTGLGVWIGEIVATLALLGTILACLRCHRHALPYAVGLVIMAGYWFTSSTSFANPAVTIARSLTDSFAGIRPADVPGFIAAQFVGAILAVWFFGWLWRSGAASETPSPQSLKQTADQRGGR